MKCYTVTLYDAERKIYFALMQCAATEKAAKLKAAEKSNYQAIGARRIKG